MSFLKNNKRFVSNVYLVVVLICIFLCNGSLSAQVDFFISADVAQFLNSKGESFIEIYYSIPEASLSYNGTPETGYNAQVLMSLKLFNGDSLWASKAWKIETSRSDTAEITILDQFVDELRYAISETGKLKVDLFAKDANQLDHVDSIIVETELREFSIDKLELSDIQLASQIKRSQPNSESKFSKGQYDVIPNPGQVYGEGSTNLFYYFEIYNMEKNLIGDKYIVNYSIFDSNRRKIESINIPPKTKRKVYNSSIELGRLDISKLPTGVYSLICNIGAKVSENLANQEKRFFIYNPEVEPFAVVQTGATSLTGNIKFLSGFTETALDDEFDKMRYIVKREHQNFYKNLKNAEGKRDYIYSLWRDLRPDKITNEAIYRQGYLERIEVADNSFSTPMKKGWLTDEGRIFILYGPPSDIERHDHEVDTKPYRIWHYENLEGGVIFILIDRLGFNRWELIHSTKRGELYDPNWEQIIRIAR